MRIIAVAIMVTLTGLAAACAPQPAPAPSGPPMVQCQSLECQSGVPAPTVVLD